MSMSNPQKEAKLKASIHDFVGPLLKRLKEEVLENKDKDLDKIIEDVEIIKNHLNNRENWDRELASFFGEIERKIDSWTDQKQVTIKPIPDSSFIRNHIEKLKSGLKGIFEQKDKNGSDSGQNNTQSEHVQSSNRGNQDTEGFMEFLECMKSLNPQLRNCLYSLAVFPENTELKKRVVVYWWIGLGLVPLLENRSRTAEQLGEIFFSDMVDKGVLMPVIREHNQVVDRCTIKPIIHRQLISACEKKGLLESKEKIDNSEETKEGSLLNYGCDNSNLKALLNLNKRYLNSKDIIKRIDVQVVQLGRWHYTKPEINNKIEETSSGETKSKDHIEVDEIEFLQKLGNKVTYLSLGGISRIEELHESIGKLENLMILDLRACHNLEKLPEKPSKIWWQSSQKSWFKKLTYLDISECYLLDHMPKWVCKLSHLEVLKGFVLGSGKNKSDSCGLQDLKDLKRIRKLSIRITTGSFKTEDFKGIKELGTLLVLTITWGGEANEANEGNEERKINKASKGEASEDNKEPEMAEIKGGETSEVSKEPEIAEATEDNKESRKAEASRNNNDSVKAEASEGNKESEIIESRVGSKDSRNDGVRGDNNDFLKGEESERNKEPEIVEVRGAEGSQGNKEPKITKLKEANKDSRNAGVSDGNKDFVKGKESEGNKELEIVEVGGAEGSQGNNEPKITEPKEGNKDSRIAQTSEVNKQAGKTKANRNNKDFVKVPTKKDDKEQTYYFPNKLEKLDIRCYPEAEVTKLKAAAELTTLKRLYIRGGKIKGFTNSTGWSVETLRLRFLDELEIDWYKLEDSFKKLECVEYVKCPKLKNFPKDLSCWRKEIHGKIYKLSN
ncbi:Disease resistance RPP13-like protein 4 [Rhynchospora pubera]|uniref:Disease resistance RPP13-like protein 4 n=1 Tax=Rhynchospora pubera TaxID=906938 RepID=A0AAV8H7B6_9POAL|nr:Disease resistance RPP13-like protein 4 [Rhynchospora pubera]